MSTEPLAPLGTRNPLLTVCPWNALMMDAFGCACPVGQTVRNGIWFPLGTTVAFNE